MGTKKIETKPTMKTWIWLKDIKSKALQDLRKVYSTEDMQKMVDKWLEVCHVGSDGDFSLEPKGKVVFKSEVAHVQQSVECPKDPPAKIARIDRTKAPKATKHVWEPRTMEIKDSVPKTTLRALILESVDEINQLGTENAKLKNQIVSLKKKGTK